MTDEYVYVTGPDGEIYEIRPTDGLLSFLQRLAEGEAADQERVLDLLRKNPERSCVAD